MCDINENKEKSNYLTRMNVLILEGSNTWSDNYLHTETAGRKHKAKEIINKGYIQRFLGVTAFERPITKRHCILGRVARQPNLRFEKYMSFAME